VRQTRTRRTQPGWKKDGITGLLGGGGGSTRGGRRCALLGERFLGHTGLAEKTVTAGGAVTNNEKRYNTQKKPTLRTEQVKFIRGGKGQGQVSEELCYRNSVGGHDSKNIRGKAGASKKKKKKKAVP